MGRLGMPRFRYLMVVLVAAVIVGLFPVDPVAAAGGFLDVPGDHTFASDISWLADQGITKGCNPPENDLFCPDDPVTRGQMAAFLVRALDLQRYNYTIDTFVDDNGSVFEADIEKLAYAGITKGCNPPENDMFCPDAVVTRGQMAAFLQRALHLRAAGSTDSFGDDNGSVFEADIEKLAFADVTRGCNPPVNNMFCPSSVVTRGQMAAFLRRGVALVQWGEITITEGSGSVTGVADWEWTWNATNEFCYRFITDVNPDPFWVCRERSGLELKDDCVDIATNYLQVDVPTGVDDYIRMFYVPASTVELLVTRAGAANVLVDVDPGTPIAVHNYSGVDVVSDDLLVEALGEKGNVLGTWSSTSGSTENSCHVLAP